MLSYRHHFHAGNHADVLKHVVLVALLRALTRKDKALCCIDSHAGRGFYTLPSADARPAPEWPEGVGRMAGAEQAPAAVSDWLAAVHALAAAEGGAATAAATAGLRHYPGSPALAAHILRPCDRLLLSELHPADAEALARRFAADPRVAVGHRDGYAEILRCLPPRERRALVFIDPAYERREEPAAVRRAIDAALARLAHACVALWVPIMRSGEDERLLAAPPGPRGTPLLAAGLTVRPRDNPLGLNGSVMLVWNPPFALDLTLADCLPWLAGRLDQGGGGWQLDWLQRPA
jgi:23S rRNA (adenine2030-N6)-methyltransferase